VAPADCGKACSAGPGVSGEVSGFATRSERPSQKLAVYGTLSPGQQNYGMLRDLDGSWTPVRLNGLLDETGLPTFSFSTQGSAVEAELLISAELAEHWSRLDEFEGSGYTRQLGLVWRQDFPRVANAYVASPSAGNDPEGRLP
jgi:gamma-glutamylcyclotransferase (GGCT)/AIG2-like uncharacterized protein YtfP